MDTVSRVFGVKDPTVFKSKITPTQVSNPSLVVGVELEIENLSRGASYYQDAVYPAWTVVDDGSLRPRGESWEFVSKPMPLGLALSEMKELFQKLKITEDNYSDRCSVHIHTNVTDFTQENLATLGVVYVPLEEVLFQFVNHFKKTEEQGYCRDTNLYCIPWNQCRMNSRLVDKIFHSPSEAFHRWQKYTALNLLPILTQGTVEWRHMHGTADMEKLTQWFNIIGSIMKFSKETTFDDVVKTIKALNDTSAYRQFFTSVLGDSLPYEEKFQASLSEGVLNAKYSMMDWELNKKKGVVAKPYKKRAGGLAFFDEEGEHPEEAEREQDNNPERVRIGDMMAAARRTAAVWNPANLAPLDPVNWNVAPATTVRADTAQVVAAHAINWADVHARNEQAIGMLRRMQEERAVDPRGDLHPQQVPPTAATVGGLIGRRNAAGAAVRGRDANGRRI